MNYDLTKSQHHASVLITQQEDSTMSWFYKTFTPMVVQQGDAYRGYAYGRAKTAAELYAAEQINIARNKESCRTKQCTRTDQQTNNFKLEFHFWDEWTGGRFERQENPIIQMTNREFLKSCWRGPGVIEKPTVVAGSICRSTPATGEWKAINERTS